MLRTETAGESHLSRRSDNGETMSSNLEYSSPHISPCIFTGISLIDPAPSASERNKATNAGEEALPARGHPHTAINRRQVLEPGSTNPTAMEPSVSV